MLGSTAQSTSFTRTGPLAPYRVLDLSWHFAGPFTGKILADYGAEVIKVEMPGTGDPSRRYGPFKTAEHDPETSAAFLYLNSNKLGVTADLKTDEGREIIRRLAADVDIVIESFRPGVLDRLGLGYRALREVNPDLIMASISNFGQTGPYRDYRATDLTAWGMGEVPYITGEASGPPVKTYGMQASNQAGINALAGIMAALWQRPFTNEGMYIDVSVLESVVNLIELSTGIYMCMGLVHRRRPGAGSGYYPRGTQQASDGELMLFFGSRRGRDVAVALDLPGLDDPKFDTNVLRWQHRGEFDEVFLPWLKEQAVDDVLLRLQLSARLPVAKIMKIDQLFQDPQFRSRDYFVSIDHPVAGPVPFPGPPFKMHGTPATYRRPAPLLGEHNDLVYGGLGYTPTQLDTFRRNGVI